MTRTRGVSLAAAAVVLAVGVGGCSSAAHKASAPSASTQTTPTTPTAAPSPMLTPTAPAGTALGSGQRVWAAFSERGLPYDDWWARLKPQLSDAARAVYVYDDPRNLPAMRLTGPIHLAAAPPAEPRFTAEVVVPTDKGVFRLDLERRTTRSRWLLYAIKFPRGVH